jgi:hypothetical protein
MFTPSTMRARASPPKITSFAAILIFLKDLISWGQSGHALRALTDLSRKLLITQPPQTGLLLS